MGSASGKDILSLSEKIKKDVVIEVVNLTRATLKEANQFKKILQEDIEKKFGWVW